MRVGNAHLTYCTNIHAGEAIADVLANVHRYLPAVKARVAPDRPFGVGLRLSNAAALGLCDVDAFQALLREHDLYVFTINGFPYGPFHGAPVKEAVYRPDWLEPERVAYTNLLADHLDELLPGDIVGSISTAPGCFRARGTDATRIAENLRRCADHLADGRARSGKHIMLALEPEPACLLETIDDAIRFFDDHLPDRTHLGICLDACHAAVEFEDLAAGLARLREARIPIAKVQLSSGLRVAPVDEAARRELARFADDVYLHQVVARRGGGLVRYVDLPEALADPAPADEWRIHFHVPIFRESLGPFSSTQPFLAELLALHKQAEISPHLEVETYTWDVLPAEYRAEPIEDAIARELRWVLERLA